MTPLRSYLLLALCALTACSAPKNPGKTPLCGDGVIDVGEACDQGNLEAGDGCSPACAVEAGFRCSGTPSVCERIPCTGDAACDDGLYCNGVEHCGSNGLCAAGAAVVVDDGIACTVDACDESLKAATHLGDNAACADSNSCTTDTCQLGVGCTHVNTCPCTLDSECDDQNLCTNDSCGTNGHCQNTNNTATCDDGLYCNGADTCNAGACSAHAGDPCTSGAVCANQCDETANTCNAVAGTTCISDGNGCTDDQCDGQGACAHTPNVAPCNDGVYCNGSDTCAAGACTTHAGDPCAAGAECANTCNEAGANCLTAAATPCASDSNDCTRDLCDGAGTCAHTSIAVTLTGTSPASPANNNAPSVVGSGAAQSTVYVFASADCSGSAVGSANTDTSGAFSRLVSASDNTVTSYSASPLAGGLCCSSSVTYFEDSAGPLTASAQVFDGLTGDLSASNSTSAAALHWAGFADDGGIAGYEVQLSSSATCTPPVGSAVDVGLSASGAITGLSLTAGSTYFSCVRARDVAGNWSAFVASNGFVVDITAPTVQSVTPAVNATNVRASSSVAVTFSEAVDCTSVGSGVLQLAQGANAVSGTVSCSGSTVTFTPAARLAYLSTFTATVSTSLKDLAGNALATAYVWSFTTGAAQWGVPVFLGSGYAPVEMTVDDSDAVMAAWMRTTPVFTGMAARFTPAGLWEAAITLDDAATPPTASASVLMGKSSANGVAAAWAQHTGAVYDARARLFVPGTGWLPPATIDASDALISGQVGIAGDPTGNVIAAWQQGGIPGDVLAARYTPGTGWGAPVAIDDTSTATWLGDVVVGADGAGNVWVLFSYSDGINNLLRANRFNATGGWQGAVTVAAVTPATPPSLGCSTAGACAAVWTQAGNEVWAARYSLSGGWATPTLLDTNASHPSLRMNAAGDGYAVWSSTTAGGNVRGARLAAASGWGTVDIIDTSVASRSPSVAVGADGSTIVVYELNDGTRYNIWARRRDPASGWQTATLVEALNTFAAQSPRAVIDSSGVPTVTFNYTSGGVYANRFE